MFKHFRYHNVEAVVAALVKYLPVEATTKTVVAELGKHPNYPSIFAISEVLENFGVENLAFRILPDELVNMRCPFIAHTQFNNGDFVLVNKIKDESIFVSNEKWNDHKLSLNSFKKDFTGVILVAEQCTSGFHRFIRRLTDLKRNFVVAIMLLIFVAAVVFQTDCFMGYTWTIFLLTLFKTLGLLVSVLLLIQSIDSNNPFVTALCRGANAFDCNSILSSKASMVFDGLTWSEVGFYYFAGTWLLIIFGGHSIAMLQVIALFNLLCLPFTIYSIYYQAVIARRWCLLCCAIQALMWMEFIPLTNFLKIDFPSLGRHGWVTVFIAFQLPVIVWVLVKPIGQRLQQLQPLKRQLHQFKYNMEIFGSLMESRPKFAGPDDCWSIVLGSEDANHQIIMVTNPFCGPCADTHKLLDELLAQRIDVQAKIVFTVGSGKEEDVRTRVCRHLMDLADLPDKSIVKRALDDWYQQHQKNYKAWAATYPVELSKKSCEQLSQQKQWCDLVEADVTPTVLLNGRRLPEIYQLSDLKYMLD